MEALPHDTSPVTIVHSSGVFIHNVAWCHCQGPVPKQHLQLLRAGLFPASSTRPKTAFTFEVLDHFLIDSLECKTSARSFFEKLTRLTNNAFPDTVPDQYRELMRVSRPGDLALFCPSCPQPGINMPLLWEQKWLVMKRLVVDGNFTAQHMNMQEPERDIFLSDGSGYMVMKSEYQAHLASATEKRVNNCPGLTLPENTEIVAAVGKFHLSAHKLACFARYSLNFILGAAQVDGEILETLWAPFNKISPTAHSMSQAHRQEILDDHMRNSNWKKLVGIGEC
ncbi:uncharacterized protein EDB93DRAFT_1237961 [Suillus bovinus]|uniref:uncharacterized protein n=1 Tax=Suillus bovinus TaxID=48563 RepID=UPI001B86F56D|nr:uncharacterized protein EDB93DRAFT_1237961 [Suillus bovinus]KAG2158719.1 hypothetical protein EDB93DRAFT_1237961 [Suillus bovinus]